MDDDIGSDPLYIRSTRRAILSVTADLELLPSLTLSVMNED